MNSEDLQDDLESNLTEILEELLRRPALWAGRAIHAEAFIYGLEALIDQICETRARPASYREFCFRAGFGAVPFTARFEQEHKCRTMLHALTNDQPSLSSELLEHEFAIDFETHLLQFIEWRRQRLIAVK